MKIMKAWVAFHDGELVSASSIKRKISVCSTCKVVRVEIREVKRKRRGKGK